jgi:hypothetical protein
VEIKSDVYAADYISSYAPQRRAIYMSPGTSELYGKRGYTASLPHFAQLHTKQYRIPDLIPSNSEYNRGL